MTCLLPVPVSADPSCGNWVGRMTILLIEDDERIISFLERGLKAEGMGVTVARTGPEGFEMGRDSEHGLIILDLMLPGMHGRDVCQELRASGVRTPILMLTAMDSLEDKVSGLRLGADDYLAKPFAFTELLARIEALLRRSGGYAEKTSLLQVGSLSFDRDTLEVRRGDRLVELTAKELALLEFLMSAPGRVMSRARILDAVWGYSTDPLTNVVDVYIRRLRAKIDDGEPDQLIKTVRGYGYKIDSN